MLSKALVYSTFFTPMRDLQALLEVNEINEIIFTTSPIPVQGFSLVHVLVIDT